MDFEFVAPSLGEAEVDNPIDVTNSSINIERNPLLVEVDVGYIGQVSSLNNLISLGNISEIPQTITDSLDDPVVIEEVPIDIKFEPDDLDDSNEPTEAAFSATENEQSFESDENGDYSSISLGNYIKQEPKEKPKKIVRDEIQCSSNKRFFCDKCGKTYKNESGLTSHLESKHTDEQFDCKICKKHFSYKNTLRTHLKKEHNTNLNPEFARKRNVLTREEGTSLLICTMCEKSKPKKFTTTAGLRLHIRAEHSENPFECSVCKRVIKYRANIKRHMHKHFLKDGFYRCLCCEFKSQSRAELTNHENQFNHIYMQRIEKKYENMKIVKTVYYQCYICGDVTTYQQLPHLLNHFRLEHSDAQLPYICSFCSKGFRTKQQIKFHEETHITTKTIPCNDCDKLFKTSRNLMAHMKISHSAIKREKQFSCTECGAMFMTIHNLKTHMKIHSDDRPFKCSFCGKGFKYAQYVEIHERSHTGQKPFQCKYCEKTFTFPNSWKVHENSHVTEKPHTCEYCSKKFRRKEHLKAHIQIHTGEKQFQCQICERKFARSGDYNRHMKTHKTD